MNRRKVVRWLLLAGITVGCVAVGRRFAPDLHEPRYQGRRLGDWLRGHPRDYMPAVQSVGTNALPYLLNELHVTDPAWLRWAEAGLARLEMGPPWEPARTRQYHARLALQIMDTNAVPALLGAVFARPLKIEDGDLGYEAAFALTWMASPAAQKSVQDRLATAMGSTNSIERRNACLAVTAGNIHGAELASRLAERTQDPDAGVREAAEAAAQMIGPKK